MSDIPLYYKGYQGSAIICFEDNLIYGRIKCIKDIISYHANSPNELLNAFREAIDAYLSYCEKTGRKPNMPNTMSMPKEIYTRTTVHEDGSACILGYWDTTKGLMDTKYIRADLVPSNEVTNQWQPIETAPKDFTIFWAYKDGRQGESRVMVREDGEIWKFRGASAHIDTWPEIKPTHWMPLPEPPHAREE